MFSVASQVEIQDIKSIAEAGYKTLICNRPDQEAGDHTPFDTLAQVAKQFGLTPVYVPISLVGSSKADQNKFDQTITEYPKPIVAYCRSGARPAVLWNRYDASVSGGRKDGPERRLSAVTAGALGVSHAAATAYAVGFNSRQTTAAPPMMAKANGRKSL
ncbi:beta-lactamase hydrolase domain-containing protein [Pacificibacter maritimus]